MSVLMMNKRRRRKGRKTTRRRRRKNPVATNVRRRRSNGGGQTWNMARILTGAGAAIVGGIAARYVSKMILRTRDVGNMGYMANAGLSLLIGVVGTRFMRGKMAKQLAALTAIGGLTATGLRFVNDRVLRGQLALAEYIPTEEIPLLGHNSGLSQIDIDLEEDVPAFSEYVAEDDFDLNI